jgi:hypothetical protein
MSESRTADVRCPRCDGGMVSRSGSRGRFWGCWRFPNCRGTRPYGTTKTKGVGRTAYRPRGQRPAVPTARQPAALRPTAVIPVGVPTATVEPLSPSVRLRRWPIVMVLGTLCLVGWLAGNATPSSQPIGTVPTTTRDVRVGPPRTGHVGGPWGPQYNGYAVVCADGWLSHSGGRQGACSHHGGVR